MKTGVLILLILFAAAMQKTNAGGIFSFELVDEKGNVIDNVEITQDGLYKLENENVSRASDLIIKRSPANIEMQIISCAKDSSDSSEIAQTFVVQKEINEQSHPSGARLMNDVSGTIFASDNKSASGRGCWKSIEFGIFPFFVSHGEDDL